MPRAVLKYLPVALLVLGCHAPGAFAQSAPGASARLYANAVASFRQARFPEAYGRFIALANVGHAPSADMALWMYRHGPTVFGSDWDISPEQLAAWTQLASRQAPVMVASSNPRTGFGVDSRTR